MRDLQDVQEHIAKEVPRTAVMYVKRLKRHVVKLRDFPELGARLDEFDLPQLREIQHGNYRVIYRYDGNRILVLTVFHAARLFDPRWLLEE